MAAFSYEASNKTWQRVRDRLAGSGGGVTTPYATGTPIPGIVAAFKDLKSYLSQHKGNPDMQLLDFVASDLSTAGGKQLGTGTGKLVAVFITKSGASGTGNATRACLKVADDATDDTTAGTQRHGIDLGAVAGASRCYVSFGGDPIANGVVVNADTTLLGTTDSATADGGPGFVLMANF